MPMSDCLPFFLDPRILEEQLDTAVDSEINIKLSRAGEVMNIQLRVDDFHKLLLDLHELHELYVQLFFVDVVMYSKNKWGALKKDMYKTWPC